MFYFAGNLYHTWLCTQNQFDNDIPVGTQYAQLSTRIDLISANSGTFPIVTKEADTVRMMDAGFVPAPELYDNGEPVFVAPEYDAQGHITNESTRTMVSFETKEFTDPCADHTPEELFGSLRYRGLI